MSVTYTDQQIAICDAVKSGQACKVVAYAGTGKTSTVLYVAGNHRVPSIYLAFNKVTSDEAKPKFAHVGQHVAVSTLHGIAFRYVGRRYADRLAKNSWQLRSALRDRYLSRMMRVARSPGEAERMIFAVMDVLRDFEQSADPVIAERHLPDEFGMAKALQGHSAEVLQVAQLVWADQASLEGTLPIGHDTYFKIWQLNQPRIDSQVIYFDEAQDANGATIDVLLQQRHAQLVAIGDPNQCLPEGTKIWTPSGEVAIESISEGDVVLSCHGNGRVESSKVTSVFKKCVNERLVRITTASGRQITSTPEHVHFAGFNKARGLDSYHVYLMERRGFGFRIGMGKETPVSSRNGLDAIVGGFRGRARAEKADRAWVLKICSSRQEALILESVWSLQYGIPTNVFEVRTKNGDAEMIRAIFAAVDSCSGAMRLLHDLGMRYDAPHHIPKCNLSDRLNLSIRLCAESRMTRGWLPLHRYTISGSDPDLANKLLDVGISVREAKKHHGGWRIEGMSPSLQDIFNLGKRIEDVAGAVSWVQTASFTSGASLPFMPAANCMAGMEIFVMSPSGDVIKDVIVNVERVDYSGYVYDLNVERTHNYIADGVVTHNCIYAWRGAKNEISRLPLPEYPLTISWRFGQEIADIANLVLKAKGSVHVMQGGGPPGKACLQGGNPPAAVVTRSNAGMVDVAVEQLGLGRKVGVLGGAEAVASMIEGAYDLWMVGKSDHPSFRLFATWAELEEAAQTSHGGTYRPIVRLVERWGYGVPELAKRLRSETVAVTEAEVVLGTPHKMKGKQYPIVRIGEDFPAFAEQRVEDGNPTPIPELIEEEANVAYVSLTRAETELQIGLYYDMFKRSLEILKPTLKDGQVTSSPRTSDVVGVQ